ncbi:hypothetical protein FA15DRAFT_87330 [Coprinopsis marcescibilis]|uniref:F-box domain-containing protein n=1 Tax=Coprinopsis marcescibilis TaxID=230819 RepID=A0A5C3LHV5_COPMA|nr:hypothetical protein FA15DRAFT_87330 [Coprinopsis marcescibilis]
MLLTLPQDVIFSIYEQLEAQDLLLLQQTCSGLCALARADHIWRNLKFPFPVDLPDNRDGLTGLEIQHSVVRALRLEANWCQKKSSILNFKVIPKVGKVLHMQFVGPSFLVALSRWQANRILHLELWHLPRSYSSLPASRVSVIEVPFSDQTDLDASISDHQITVAFTTSTNQNDERTPLLQVFKFDCRQFYDGYDYILPTTLPEEIFNGKPAFPRGVFTSPIVHNNTVIAVLEKTNSNPLPVKIYNLFVVNVATGNTSYVTIPRLGRRFMKAKLYRDVMYIIGILEDESILVTAHLWPPHRTDSDGEDLPVAAKHRIGPFNNTPYVSCYISQERTNNIDSPLTIFLTGDEYMNDEGAYHSVRRKWFGFSVPKKSNETEREGDILSLEPFCATEMDNRTTRVFTCIGKTGRRMVWSEFSDIGSICRLMKGGFEPDSGEFFAEPFAGLPLNLNPGIARGCTAMCFEECSGRICFALPGDMLLVEL